MHGNSDTEADEAHSYQLYNTVQYETAEEVHYYYYHYYYYYAIAHKIYTKVQKTALASIVTHITH